MDAPAVTHRESFAQVVMESLLRERLRKINLRDGNPWLDEARLDQAVAAITRLPANKVLEANKQATELLEEAMALCPEDKALDDGELLSRPPRVKAATQAWRYRQVLRELEFAVVFSGGNNDDSAWTRWSDRAAVENHIKHFNKPLPPLDGAPPKDEIPLLRDGASVDGEAIPEMPAHAEPFWRKLMASAGLEPEQMDAATAQTLLDATEEVVATIQQEIAIPDFWKPSHIPDQERLKQHLFSQLMMGSLVPMDQAEATAWSAPCRTLSSARSGWPGMGSR